MAVTDYDPAWDMPRINWEQQGSFERGVLPPDVDPAGGTQVCIGPIALEWLPYVLGSLDQLRNPSTWLVADDAEMDQTLRRVDLLRELIATGEGCQVPVLTRFTDTCMLQTSSDGGANWVNVPGWFDNFGNCVRAAMPPPVPGNPNDDRIQLHACNIAGYIAQEILKLCMDHIVAFVGTNNEALGYGNDVMKFLAGSFPITAGFVNALTQFYNDASTKLLTQVEAARDDPTLWSDVTCAIYSAIRTVGYVDESNFAACEANIRAITYTDFWVTNDLGNWWNNAGLGTIRNIQVVGAIDNIDCSGCATVICVRHDFSQGDGGWTAEAGAGAYVNGYAGFAWYQQAVSGGRIALRMSSPLFPPSFKITGLDITISDPSGLTVTGDRAVYAQDVCNSHNDSSQAFTNSSIAPGVVLHVPLAPGAGIQCVKIDFDSDNTIANSGYISRIDILGTGVNPVGEDNCV